MGIVSEYIRNMIAKQAEDNGLVKVMKREAGRP